MQEPNNIEETVDSIKDYVRTEYALVVLKGADKFAHFVSNFISLIPIMFFSILMGILLSFGLAFYLNTVFVSEYVGFLIVGGGYFVIVLFVICVRKNLVAKPFRNLIIREIFKNNQYIKVDKDGISENK